MATVQTPSITDTIAIAEASMVYAGRDINKKSFRPNTVNNNLALQLDFAVSVLDWTYNYDPSNTDIKLMRNYTLKLCGQYIGEAQTNMGTGGIVIIPTNSIPFGFQGYRSDFVIGQPGSLMNAGDISVTINLPGFIDKTVFMFPLGAGILPIGVPAGAFNIISTVYTPTSVTILLDQAVQDGEGYTITGLRYAAATSISGGGAGLPNDDGHEGEVLFTDGAGNPYWADVIIDIISADFESDGITVIDTRMLHNNLDIYWNEGGRWLDATTEYTRILSGGFTINISGFDANTQTITMKVILRGLNS